MTRRRELVCTVRSITYPGAGLVHRVLVRLDTDDGPLTLHFMSRTTLECVDIGTKIRVAGALTRHRGVPTMFNPSLEVTNDDD